MAFVPVDNVVEVALRYLLPDTAAANVLTFYCTYPLTQSRVCSIAEQVADWWETDLRDWQGTHLTLQEVYARDLTNDMSYTCTDSRWSGYHGGYGAGSPLPSNVAACLSLRTEARGRSGRGRQYTTALTTNHVSGDYINSNYAAGIKAAYDKLLPAGGALTDYWQWCIVSRYHNRHARENGIWNLVTHTLWVNMVLDSARRRLPG